MAQMVLDHLAHVINRVQLNPTAKLQSLLGISPSGVEQIQAWNSRVALHRTERCVHDVIAEQCQANPSADAVSAWDGTLTYAQLDTLSTTLAARLAARGHGPGKFIGLLFEKSMWTAVSLLAVMKAGSAFFPIDPSLPDQRIKRMCQISEAVATITSPGQSDRAQKFGPPVAVAQHESQSHVSDTPSVSLPTVNPGQAAYLAFTSGSTGDPKAVVVEHTAVCSGIGPYSTRMGLNPQSRVFQFASYSFVISVLDHMGAFMNGACLCVPSTEQIQNSLLRTMRACNANWVEITPSVARALDPDSLPMLRTVVLTGEAATRADVEKWTRGKVVLKTCYGQSENSLGALVDTKTGSSEAKDMGYPWAAHCWIVDSRGCDELIPIGAEGELWIEGPSLARGYLKNEEQTAATFISNPPWMRKVRPGESARFLKTGDIVRYKPEAGLLQYVGRQGTQVKLRGQRIELAEVEVQLRKQFPAAEAAVAEIVNTSEDENDTILAAFVAVGQDRAYDEGSLFAPITAEFSNQIQEALAQLREILPRFMVPTTILPLAALPLTPSGKLNRKLLRSKACELGDRLQTYHILSEKAYRPPRTANEVLLGDICADIHRLNPSKISMDATIFEIGGNSMTTMNMVSRAREAGFCFTTEHVFQQMSLAQLAEHREEISAAREADDLSSAAARKGELMHLIPPGVQPDNVSDIFACIYHQQYLFDHHEGGCFLFHFSGLLDPRRLQAACQRLVETHTSLRSIFRRNLDPAFEIYPNTDHDPTTIARDLCAVNPAKAFPPGLPLPQFTLVGSGEEHALVMRLSHAQYDGTCQQTIVSDLCAFYKDPEQVGHLTNFAPYSQHVAQQQTPEAFSFWKDHLAGSKTSTKQKKDTILRHSDTISFKAPLPPAWATVLREATGTDDIVFAQLITLRDMPVPQIHRLVGPCLNQVPVRIDYAKLKDPTCTVLDLLHAVQGQHAQAIRFKALSWDNLVEKSTGWPGGTQPQSLVLHQNYDLEKKVELGGSLDCELVDYVPIRVTTDGELERLLEKMCNTLQHFIAAPGSALQADSTL
ncbi:hypothetical protein BDW59DRAFT_177767 [Aspergillus cavernicola]|uniref:Carrier domain-containing protein n=1 Tax=Aspergillus cavernicola TaxID=176166 RepID=A0ABR4HHV6_9EURO